MKVVGDAAAHGSVEAVWDALHETAVLARAIPGCERFEVTGPGLAEFVATTALPAIGGTYAGKLTIVEQQRPSLLRLTASATGDQGTITADVTVSLGDGAGATLVSYEANGTVTGPVAAVGTRLLTTAAKRLAGEFFAGIDESVSAHPPTTSASAAAVPAATQAAAAQTAARPRPAASEARRPPSLERPGPMADNRVVLVAGAAIGLAGIVIGVLAGRRGGRAGREPT
ncbi:MAG TPA: SRPBCC domain-containing protein [Streptosporangiaceae bacterium]|nr:SRPBCC domain-containing protein [Streptosporangiaceae bacterium]